MTEAEWLAGTGLGPMVEFLRGRASDRRLRLFAVACCQQLMPWNQNRRVVEALIRAERYADGGLAESTMEKWYQELNRISYEIRREMGGGGNAQTTICWAVGAVCLPRRYDGFVNAWQALTNMAGVFGPEFSGRGPAIVRTLLDDTFGNPFRPVAVEPDWRTSTVAALATGIYADRAFDRLPILADALEDAGCEAPDVLAHCRSDGVHVRGCWVVDLVLGKT
jgi:hypothetical protein